MGYIIDSRGNKITYEKENKIRIENGVIIDDNGIKKGGFTTTNASETIIDYDTEHIGAGGGNDIITSYSRAGGHCHVYAGYGNDTLNLAFSEESRINIKNGKQNNFIWGHHAFGGWGSDTFNFEGTEHIKTGEFAVGRIADYDHSQDIIKVDGVKIDLENLPENMRILEYTEPANERFFDDGNQWLHIKTSAGGDIFYAIEEARSLTYKEGAPPGRGNDFPDELHFLESKPKNFESLKEVQYEDQRNWVPSYLYEGKGYNFVKASPDYHWTMHGKREDKVYGTSRNDIIQTLMREDKVYAGAGNDLVAGGSDDDLLYGGDGSDKIWGGSEDDRVFGGNHNDELRGNDGEDRLYGGHGNDRLYGGDGNDWMTGGTGTDTMRGGRGIDTVSYADNSSAVRLDLREGRQSNGDYFNSIENLTGSNSGNDRLIGDDENNRLSGIGGSDSISGLAGNDYLYGGDQNDYLYGGEGTDYLYGGNHNDKLYGGNHNDKLYGGNHNDKLYGGTGVDYLHGHNHNDYLYGGDQNDYLYGGEGNDHLDGGHHDDKLYGHNGNDTLIGNDGNDYLRGYNHDDKIYGGEGNDKIFGDAGKDLIYGGNGNDTIWAGNGADKIYGGAGTDGVSYYGASSGQTINLNKYQQANGDYLHSIENIYGSNAGNDTLTGNNNANRLYGGGGDDILNGSGGNDRLYGAAGDDVFIFTDKDGADAIYNLDTGTGTSGHDTIRIASTSYNSYADIQNVMSQSGAHVKIDFGSGHKITLVNTNLAEMNADMFDFV